MREIQSYLWELALPHLQTRHNEEHTRISCEFARILVEEEKGDEDIVLPAVILHDLGWSKVPENLQLTAFGPDTFDEDLRRVHEIEGAKMAREILLQVRYPSDKLEEITAIIEGHDSRLEPLSLNDQLVKDADKLFRFTPTGFTFTYESFKLEPHQWHKRLTRLVEEWLYTASAKTLAQEQLDRLTLL